MNIDSAPSQPSPTLLIHQTDLMLFQHTTAYLPQIGPRNTILPTFLNGKWHHRFMFYCPELSAFVSNIYLWFFFRPEDLSFMQTLKAPGKNEIVVCDVRKLALNNFLHKWFLLLLKMNFEHILFSLHTAFSLHIVETQERYVPFLSMFIVKSG